MIKYIKLIILISSFVFFVSCNRQECKNKNPVFNTFTPEQKQYKDELVKQLKLVDMSKLTYWFENYKEKNSVKYLLVYIQGEGICAQGLITVRQADAKLEGIIRSKGLEYRGAALKGLTFDMYQDSAMTELLYRGLDAVID